MFMMMMMMMSPIFALKQTSCLPFNSSMHSHRPKAVSLVQF